MIARLLLFVGLLCFAQPAFGQAGEYNKKRTKAGPSRLEQAERLSTSDPAGAINLLNEAIKAKPATAELTRAFLLLGDIYADIGQYELALGRYEQAQELTEGKDRVGRASIQAKQGSVLLRSGDFARARAAFQSCLKLAGRKGQLATICREGLADVEASLENFTASQALYGQVKGASPDSLTQVRVNAKQANVYLRQNDLPNAANSIDSALTQVPRGQQLSQLEVKELITANSNVRNAVIVNDTEDDNTSYGSTFDYELAPKDLLTTDKLASYKALRQVGKANDAERELLAALNSVTAQTPPEVSTQIYADGADYFLNRNQPERAAEIYRNYTNENNRLLADRRAEVERQVAVLKAQQNVDLGLKDLRASEVQEQLLSEQVTLQRWLIYLLGALLLGALLSVILILRNVRKRQQANQALLLRNLQNRMNPHFIFNSLNSINNYIARQDERSANRYLGRFARLMRNVLDQSGKDFVSLTEELEQLALYLELEQERFTGKFTYELPSPSGYEDVELPPMILQPFVENAIWHGLRYRPEGGLLTVTVHQARGRTRVTITDNGIGRKQSAELKTKNQRNHRSTGLATTRQRLELVNSHYGRDLTVTINDAEVGAEYPGTVVELLV